MAIGTSLLERGILSPDQLDRAVSEQRASGDRLDRVIVRLGFATRAQVLEAVGDQFRMPVVDVAGLSVDPAVLATLPSKLVFRQRCVPISRENGVLTVATSDPYEISVLDELRLLTGCAIQLVLADEEELHGFIRANYGVGGDTLDAMSEGLDSPSRIVEAKPADEPRPRLNPKLVLAIPLGVFAVCVALTLVVVLYALVIRPRLRPAAGRAASSALTRP